MKRKVSFLVLAVFSMIFVFKLSPLWTDLNDGLVLYYSFKNCNAHDDSGHNNDGIIIGNPVCKKGFHDNGALYFNNPQGGIIATQYIKIPYSFSIQMLENTSFTINLCYITNDYYQLNGRLFGNTKGIVIDYNSGAQPNPYAHISDGLHTYNVALNSSNIKVTDGNYHCQTIILDRQNLLFKEYIDGILIDKTKITDLGKISMKGLTVGATKEYDTYASKNLLLDDLSIFNRVLSNNEIIQLYEQGITKGECNGNDYNKGFEEGKKYCKENPSACGISTGGDYNEGYKAGKEYCKNHPSECGMNCPVCPGVGTENNCSTFDFMSGEFYVPCFNGGDKTYWLKFNLINSNPVQLELKNFGINK